VRWEQKGRCRPAPQRPLVKVDRSKQTGTHLGAAGQLVRKAVNALNGVPFIDEA
jgi:hypothetical protein